MATCFPLTTCGQRCWHESPSERPTLDFEHSDAFANCVVRSKKLFPDLPASVEDEINASDYMTHRTFELWRKRHKGKIVHIKGYGGGMTQNDTWAPLALSMLSQFPLVAWDVDPPEETGFTSLITELLHHCPGVTAIAFKTVLNVGAFWKKWKHIRTKFGSRILVVGIDLEAEKARFNLAEEAFRVASFSSWVQDFYFLGRIAMKITASSMAISLGGGPMSLREADVSLPEGVKWVVFALNQDSEENGGLHDWDVHSDNPNVEFVRDIDHGVIHSWSMQNPKRVEKPLVNDPSVQAPEVFAGGDCPSSSGMSSNPS